jgi:hypothetical protein
MKPDNFLKILKEEFGRKYEAGFFSSILKKSVSNSFGLIKYLLFAVFFG